jgi:arginyl-tRNA synthetase
MKEKIEQAVQAAVQAVFAVEINAELTRPEQQFGDFSTNAALRLSKQLGKNPREIAEALVERLQADLADEVTAVTIAGPGFINLTLSNESLVASLQAGPAQTNSGKVVLAEYSDPNPFKPLHAGHLYTTLVGDVIARLIEASGANVTRINYGGDVGLHVGKSMWSIVRELGGELPDKLADITESDRPQWLGNRYVEGNNAYEDDETARAEIVDANRRVYELHNQDDHDSPFAQIYWICRGWSYEYFKQLYAQLDVHQFDRMIPESEVVPLGVQMVREHIGDVYQESDGAIVFKGEEFGLHTRVFINSQGLPTYEAKDVGLLFTKWNSYHYDRSIYITANEQAQYMQVMLKSVEQFAPEPAQKSEHLTHGIVKLQGGVKMSSRKGNIVSAVDILDAARAANKQLTGQDNQATVLGAVKYAFLKNRIGGDIAYDPVESVSLEGNSGPYLQYAHARACSILRKAPDTATESQLSADLEADERSLVRKLSEYAEIVDKAVAELMPHHICGYLYELAQEFNRFYEHNRVLDDPRQHLRLSLVRQYADTLSNGLQLLGIIAPEQM